MFPVLQMVIYLLCHSISEKEIIRGKEKAKRGTEIKIETEIMAESERLRDRNNISRVTNSIHDCSTITT